MANGFFHLSYGYGEITQNGWRISGPLKAARESTVEAIADRMATQFDQRGDPVREAWLAIVTKFGTLEVVSKRLAETLELLRADLAADPEQVETCAGDADDAYTPKDGLLPILLVESVDAFILQHRSAYEMMGKFVRQFCAVILASPVTWHAQEVIERITLDASHDPAWIYTLKNARDRFAHNYSPWMGVRVTDGKAPEVFILKSDLSTPDSPDDVLSLVDLQKIYHGFSRGVDDCAKWMVRKIEDLGAGAAEEEVG